MANRCNINFNLNTLHQDIYLKLLGDDRRSRTAESRGFFVSALFPQELGEVLFGGVDQNASSLRVLYGRVFMDQSGGQERMLDCGVFLSETPGSFENFPLLDQLSSNWKALLHHPDQVALHSALHQILRSIREDALKARLLPLLQNRDYPLLLASCTLLAVTLPYWNHAADNDVRDLLKRRILPPDPADNGKLDYARKMVTSETGSIGDLKTAMRSLSAEHNGERHWLLYQRCRQLIRQGSARVRSSEADSYLEIACKENFPAARREQNTRNARALLDNQLTMEPYALCQDCEKLIEDIFPPADEEMGQLCFLLYTTMNNCGYQSRLSRLDYLKMAFDYGCEDAREPWRKLVPFSLSPKFKSAQSKKPGHIYLDTNEPLSKIYRKSIPGNWTVHSTEEAEIHLADGLPKNYLFLSSDFLRNLRQTIDLLELLNQHYRTHGKMDEVQLFLRGNLETASSLIDTAMQHLPQPVPVYILDDAQLAVQQLFNRHPLFYPIHNAKSDQEGTLHLVFLGNQEIGRRLIREAFWMMHFPNFPKIDCRISLFAPNGKEIVEELLRDFPGMNNPPAGIPAPRILGENYCFNDPDLIPKLTKLDQSSYCYFVVAGATPLDSLELAKNLRQNLVRSHLLRRRENRLNQPAPIAFYCPDDYIAGLSRGLLVEKESFGNRWFNNYALIPFGDPAELYTWNELGTNSVIEKLAQCIHLEFYGIKPNSSPREKTSAMTSYWMRVYNRESSQALAVSLNYRLFQFRQENGSPVIPRPWNFLDGSNFTEAQLCSMAKKLEQSPWFGEDTERVARWEHDRWNLWMLSRGWQAATEEDAQFGQALGNRRHQIHIARLHPCLCDYEALQQVSDALAVTASDKKNVAHTPELVRLDCLRERETER